MTLLKFNAEKHLLKMQKSFFITEDLIKSIPSEQLHLFVETISNFMIEHPIRAASLIKVVPVEKLDLFMETIKKLITRPSLIPILVIKVIPAEKLDLFAKTINNHIITYPDKTANLIKAIPVEKLHLFTETINNHIIKYPDRTANLIKEIPVEKLDLFAVAINNHIIMYYYKAAELIQAISGEQLHLFAETLNELIIKRDYILDSLIKAIPSEQLHLFAETINKYMIKNPYFFNNLIESIPGEQLHLFAKTINELMVKKDYIPESILKLIPGEQLHLFAKTINELMVKKDYIPESILKLIPGEQLHLFAETINKYMTKYHFTADLIKAIPGEQLHLFTETINNYILNYPDRAADLIKAIPGEQLHLFAENLNELIIKRDYIPNSLIKAIPSEQLHLFAETINKYMTKYHFTADLIKAIPGEQLHLFTETINNYILNYPDRAADLIKAIPGEQLHLFAENLNELIIKRDYITDSLVKAIPSEQLHLFVETINKLMIKHPELSVSIIKAIPVERLDQFKNTIKNSILNMALNDKDFFLFSTPNNKLIKVIEALPPAHLVEVIESALYDIPYDNLIKHKLLNALDPQFKARISDDAKGIKSIPSTTEFYLGGFFESLTISPIFTYWHEKIIHKDSEFTLVQSYNLHMSSILKVVLYNVNHAAIDLLTPRQSYAAKSMQAKILTDIETNSAELSVNYAVSNFMHILMSFSIFCNNAYMMSSKLYKSDPTLAGFAAGILKDIGNFMAFTLPSAALNFIGNIVTNEYHDSLSIYKLLSPFLKAVKLNSNSNSKSASDILYHDSFVYYGNNSRAEINKDILHIYKNLEQDSLFKYFMYVFALNAKESLFPLSYFYNEQDWKKILKTLGFSSPVVGVAKIFMYESINLFKVIEYDDLLTTVSHEIAHSVYRIIYSNNCEPFAPGTEAQAEYQNILTITQTNFKDSQSTPVLRFATRFKGYPEYQMSSEMIAYYFSAYFSKLSGLDNIFQGYKDYILHHNIPDFIEYIENHPRCNEIEHLDNSINCKTILDNYDISLDDNFWHY